MTRIKTFLRRTDGSAAVEFAIAAPILLLMIFGLIKLGMMFSANAGLQHAVDEGARLATIFPTPTDAQILARARSRRFGIEPARITEATVVRGEDAGADYADITMRYAMPVNFVFFDAPDVTLTRTRRAYLPQ